METARACFEKGRDGGCTWVKGMYVKEKREKSRPKKCRRCKGTMGETGIGVRPIFEVVR